MISVKVDGMAKTLVFLKLKNKNAEQQVKKGITKATVFLHGEVKQSIAGHRAEYISVDTGRFLNSVEFQVDKLTGKVFSKVPYAGKLEFGTGFHDSPRKHFTNSADRSKPKITDLIKKEVQYI